MKWIMKQNFLCLFLYQILMVLASLIELFARSYTELTLTFLVVEVLVLLLSFIGMKKKIYILSIFASSLCLAGAILLVCFPNYVSFAVFILTSIALVWESASLILSIIRR